MLRKHFKDSSDVLNKALIVPATAKWQQKGFKCGATAVLQVDLNSIPWFNCALAPCKRIRDSLGFWIPRRRFRISGRDFGFVSGTWIPDFSFAWDSGFESPLAKIPDSTSKNFLDSGIRISLHGASRCATAVLQVELDSIPSLNVARQNLKFKNALIFLWPWHEEPFPWKPLLQTQTWRSLFNGSVVQIALASHSGFCLQSNPVANIRLSSSTMESSESKKYARLSL